MNPLAWLNPGRWMLYAALAAALVLAYFAWADHIGDVREAQIRAQYAAQAKEADDKRAAVAAPVAAKQEAAQVQIRTVFKTIIQEVPVYVQATDPPMSPGFRVLHDAAADGVVPDPTRVADAAPAPAQAVATTVATNYEACRANAADLTLLQEWITQQQRLNK